MHRAEAVLFDQALSPAQQRNLERHLGVAVADRTMLILEIFGARAQSHEGKLQVELARLQYLSTRLVRRWSHLERQRGGIGARGGPGEAQIELDRRMIGERIKGLKKQLEKVKRQRSTQRRSRERNQTFRISLVGYTNAGKSTLFNALVDARVHAADQLFATLDTTTRQLRLEGRAALGLAVGHRRLHPRSPAQAGRGVRGDAAGGQRRGSAAPRGRRRQSAPGRADRRGRTRAGRDRRCRDRAGDRVQPDRPARGNPASADGRRPGRTAIRSARHACVRQRTDRGRPRVLAPLAGRSRRRRSLERPCRRPHFRTGVRAAMRHSLQARPRNLQTRRRNLRSLAPIIHAHDHTSTRLRTRFLSRAPAPGGGGRAGAGRRRRARAAVARIASANARRGLPARTSSWPMAAAKARPTSTSSGRTSIASSAACSAARAGSPTQRPG